MPQSSATADVSLTVLIPCFNEARILKKTIDQLTAYLDSGQWRHGLRGEWEILVVDDGSKDDTPKILKQANSSDARVRFVSYRPNQGQGHALQTGFKEARGEWIFCVDADLDYGPEHIERFVSLAAETGAKIVIGSAYMEGGTTKNFRFARYWMSRSMNWYFEKVLTIGFSTYTSILRLYDRRAIQSILLTSRDKDILPEIIIKARLLGIPMIETPAHLHWKELETGRSGASIVSTGKKAVRHLLWGAMENPLLFFVLPAAITGLGTVWFGAALTKLFLAAYAKAPGTGLDAITAAASSVVKQDPQTVFIFSTLMHAALLLFVVGMVTLQNKIKKEHDFLYFTRLNERMNERPD